MEVVSLERSKSMVQTLFKEKWSLNGGGLFREVKISMVQALLGHNQVVSKERWSLNKVISFHCISFDL